MARNVALEHMCSGAVKTQLTVKDQLGTIVLASPLLIRVSTSLLNIESAERSVVGFSRCLDHSLLPMLEWNCLETRTGNGCMVKSCSCRYMDLGQTALPSVKYKCRLQRLVLESLHFLHLL